MDETRLTARLPTLDVEITMRKLVEENAEAITLQMKAVPSFEAMARWLAQPGILPFALVASPFNLWTEAIYNIWKPWLSLALPFARPLPRRRGHI